MNKTLTNSLNNLLPNIFSITEQAALAAYTLVGKGASDQADNLAVEAMRKALNNLTIDGTIVIGEGERDKAPMLFIGEKVGKGGIELDIAVDPLECTSSLANGISNSLSVIALSPKGELLAAPDIYMDKIACGINFPERIIDLDNSLKENLTNVALAKKCSISDLTVTILDRPRHAELIAKIREMGARASLISDGDVAAVISTTNEFFDTDLYMGIGGAPEGVLAAAALQNLKGQICTKLLFDNTDDKQRANLMGISNLARQYFLNDLASKNSIFLITGVTTGKLVKGIRKNSEYYYTSSLIMYQGIIRHIETKHPINR